MFDITWLKSLVDEIRPMQDVVEAGGHLVSGIAAELRSGDDPAEKALKVAEALALNAPALMHAMVAHTPVALPHEQPEVVAPPESQAEPQQEPQQEPAQEPADGA